VLESAAMLSRREKGKGGRGGALRALLDAGDHRSAGVEARRTLADPAALPEEQDGARAALASLRPEPGAVVTGLAGAALAVAVTLGTVFVG
jgi:hypothetical protein